MFADAWYWIALINRFDQHYGDAQRARSALNDRQVVTTDEVLVEFLAHYAGSGPGPRSAAAEWVVRLQATSEIQVVPQSRGSFETGLDLYRRRPDKGYSLTDCISMATMRSLGISDVLTADDHFRQEGFALLP